MNRMTIAIGGMSCGHCVDRVAKALERLDRVELEQVRVGGATVAYDPTVTSEERILEAIERQGYEVTASGS
jgi:copper chaperone CopZ